jgi:hypothetical protein
MGWASMKSLSGPAHGLEPTAQQLRPLAGLRPIIYIYNIRRE